MTVGNIIGEGLLAHGFFKKNDERMQEYIIKTMEDAGLASYFLHRFPHQFSGGQRQRIGIARSPVSYTHLGVIRALSRPWGLIVAALMGSGSISLPIWAWAVIGVAGLFIFYFAMKYSAQIEEALLRFMRKIVPQKTKIDRK